MKQIQLDGYSNYILHRLGAKGGPIPVIELKEDIARRGKTKDEAFRLIDAMRIKGILTIENVGQPQAKLTAMGKTLYSAKRE
ncbi:MAG: hypothetical protein KGH54_04230 [Candidatus Micrarchaeota archaeon]|nr:hypothetical protein [Candidatus Micrarchaeota archaeon]